MRDFKLNSFKKARNIKREIIFADLALMVLGLIMAIFPEQSNDIIIIAIGIALCIWGALRLISYFSHDSLEIFGSFSLVQGATLIGFGIFFIVRPSALQVFLAASLGTIIIIGGVMKLQYAVDMIRLKISYWWISLITAIITIALGVISLINPFTVLKWLMLFIGIAFIVNGALDLVSVVMLSNRIKKTSNGIIDVESSYDDDDDDDYDD